MTKIKYNVADSKKICEEMRNYLNEYKQKVDSIYEKLANIKKAWNGVDADTFVSIVNNDYNDYVNLFKSLFAYQNSLENFIKNINNSFNKIGYNGDIYMIEYDSSKLENCMSNFDKINGYINSSDDDFLRNLWPYEYDLDDVNDILHRLRTAREDCNNVKSKLNNLKSGIDKAILKSEEDIKGINYYVVNSKVVDIYSCANNVVPIGFDVVSKLSSSYINDSSNHSNDVKTKSIEKDDIDTDKFETNEYNVSRDSSVTSLNSQIDYNPDETLSSDLSYNDNVVITNVADAANLDLNSESILEHKNEHDSSVVSSNSAFTFDTAETSESDLKYNTSEVKTSDDELDIEDAQSLNNDNLINTFNNNDSLSMMDEVKDDLVENKPIDYETQASDELTLNIEDKFNVEKNIDSKYEQKDKNDSSDTIIGIKPELEKNKYTDFTNGDSNMQNPSIEMSNDLKAAESLSNFNSNVDFSSQNLKTSEMEMKKGEINFDVINSYNYENTDVKIK